MRRLKNSKNTFCLCLMLLLGASVAQGQNAAPEAMGVTGAGNYIRVVEDLDRTVAFYYALVGVEPRGGLVQRDFGVLEPVASMYNAVGGEFRGASFTVPNTTFVLEHLEWRDVDRSIQHTRIDEVGTAVLLLFVRDMNAAIQAILNHGGSIVTPGAAPVSTENGKFILAQDPDGYFVELLQINAMTLQSESNVLTGRFRLTVADAEKSARFYQDALGFGFPAAGSFSSDAILSAMNGTSQASRLISAQVPGSTLLTELIDYQGMAESRLQQQLPRIGSSMLRIFVSDLDSVVSHALDAGAVLAANNEQQVEVNGSRFQIIEDPDGLLIQFVQRP